MGYYMMMLQLILHPPYHSMMPYDGGHGRVETRAVRVTEGIAWIAENHAWSGLQSIVAATTTRESESKVTEETRYFVSSLTADEAETLEHAVLAPVIRTNLQTGRCQPRSRPSRIRIFTRSVLVTFNEAACHFSECRTRHTAGVIPDHRLNARLNAVLSE